MAYVTKEEVRLRTADGTTTASLDDTQLDMLIAQASRYFDLECGVTPEYFEAAGATATDLVVYGDGTHFLKLPPYVEGSLDTDITVPDGYTAPTFIERDGYLILASTGVMTHRIAPFPSPFYGGWYSGVPITVSAKWGYEAVPDDVKMAVIELVINLWRETDPATLNLLDLERQPLREKLPPRVMEVVKRYRMSVSPAFV